MPPVGEILYVEVPKTSKKFNSGNWLFHTGRWTALGELVKKGRGACSLEISSSAPAGKSLDEIPASFSSLDDALNFLRQFYGVPVRRATSRDLPDPKLL